VKSFSPAGLAIKGYYGLGARTFGNPSGATSGDGGVTGGALAWNVNFSGFAAGSVPNTVLCLDSQRAVVGCTVTGEILFTTDGGATWTAAANANNRRDVFDFAYDGLGDLVAYGVDNSNNAQLSVSFNGGQSWTDVTPANFVTVQSGTGFKCVQWNAVIQKFVCFAEDGTTATSCFTSFDGLAWNSALLSSPNLLVGDFRIYNGLIVVVGRAVAPSPDRLLIQRSADGGATWATVLNAVPTALFQFLDTVEFNGSGWNATGSDQTNNTNFNYTAPASALAWTLQNTVPVGGPPPYDTLQASTGNGGLFVSFSNVGATTTDIGLSPTGVGWSQVTIPNAVSFVLNIANTLYGFGDGIDASLDGTHWQSQLAQAGGSQSVNYVNASGPVGSAGVLSLACGTDAANAPTIWKFSTVVPAVPGSVTFTIVAGPNSNGPYVNGPPNTYEFAAGSGTVGPPSGSTAGAINGDPVLVNAATIVAVGQVSSGPGPHYNTLCLQGVLPQNYFTNWVFDDGAGNHYDLSSASANFNTPWDETGGGFTIWSWPVPSGQEFAPLNQPMTVNW